MAKTWLRPTLKKIISWQKVFNTQYIEAEKKCPPFPDDIFKYIFLKDNIEISIVSLKFVRKGLIDNYPASVQIMA